MYHIYLDQNNDWSVLSTTPATVSNRGDHPETNDPFVELSWGVSKPSIDSFGFILNKGEKSRFEIPTGSTLYARNTESSNAILLIIGE